jgi:hypothetical protein
MHDWYKADREWRRAQKPKKWWWLMLNKKSKSLDSRLSKACLDLKNALILTTIVCM